MHAGVLLGCLVAFMRDAHGNSVEAVQKQDAAFAAAAFAAAASAKSAWPALCKVRVQQESSKSIVGKAKQTHRKARFEFLVALDSELCQACGPQLGVSRFFHPRACSLESLD